MVRGRPKKKAAAPKAKAAATRSKTTTNNPEATVAMNATEVEELVAQRVADAIAQYEAGRSNGSVGNRESEEGKQTNQPVTFITTINPKPLN